jgi:hypothetical protein
LKPQAQVPPLSLSRVRVPLGPFAELDELEVFELLEQAAASSAAASKAPMILKRRLMTVALR